MHLRYLFLSLFLSLTSNVATGTSDGELSSEQKAILDAVLKGHNLFYTGPAGTGKSFMLEHIVNGLRNMNKTIFLTAPTGVAATNIGVPLHSFAGVGMYFSSSSSSLPFLVVR